MSAQDTSAKSADEPRSSKTTDAAPKENEKPGTPTEKVLLRLWLRKNGFGVAGLTAGVISLGVGLGFVVTGYHTSAGGALIGFAGALLPLVLHDYNIRSKLEGQHNEEMAAVEGNHEEQMKGLRDANAGISIQLADQRVLSSAMLAFRLRQSDNFDGGPFSNSYLDETVALRSGVSFHGADLARARWRFLTAPEADFTHAEMVGTELRGKFPQAKFVHAELHRESLTEDKRKTMLEEVPGYAELAEAAAREVEFTSMFVTQGTVLDGDFSGADFTGVNASGAEFRGDFDRATFIDASVERSRFLCSLSDVDFTGVLCSSATFGELLGVVFDGATLLNTAFDGVRMRHVSFRGALLSGWQGASRPTSFKGTKFDGFGVGRSPMFGPLGCDFSGAWMYGVDLSTVQGVEYACFDEHTVIERVKFPEGFDPESAGAVILDTDQALERMRRFEVNWNIRQSLLAGKDHVILSRHCPNPKCHAHSAPD